MKTQILNATVLTIAGATLFAWFGYLLDVPLSTTLDRWYWYTIGTFMFVLSTKTQRP